MNIPLVQAMAVFYLQSDKLILILYIYIHIYTIQCSYRSTTNQAHALNVEGSHGSVYCGELSGQSKNSSQGIISKNNMRNLPHHPRLAGHSQDLRGIACGGSRTGKARHKILLKPPRCVI